jgi:UDP-N-acetylmuramoylalanine--D-glutamate ligase
MRVVVLGLAATGESVARHFLARGDSVTVLEDAPSEHDEYQARAARVRAAGAEVLEAPSTEAATALAISADLVVPSPGVPERHAALARARRAGVPVRAEIDLAAEEAAGGPALVAITGTNGKTTVTTLTATMLEAAGVSVAMAGNIGRPLLDAVSDPVAVVVAEVSSFQLAATTAAFRPRAAALLNLGPDHLDWHRTFDAYARAKARVFAHQDADALLVFNADDPVVAGLAADAPGRRMPFSVAPGAARGYRLADTAAGTLLLDAAGRELAAVDRLPRRGPADLANALAASALAIELGASTEAVAGTLESFTGLAHRLQPVARHDDVTYVDDSKATNVHATIAAVDGFASVVLIAGGRNKGLDLGGLAVVAPRVRAAVAIGEAAAEIAEVMSGAGVLVITAGSMHDAVRAAAAQAQAGDTVLLSPACASFDWYESYAARGDDFAAEVRALVEVER